jgi:hypothetical protein
LVQARSPFGTTKLGEGFIMMKFSNLLLRALPGDWRRHKTGVVNVFGLAGIVTHAVRRIHDFARPPFGVEFFSRPAK